MMIGESVADRSAAPRGIGRRFLRVPGWLSLMVRGICWALGGCAGHSIRSNLSEEERREDLEYLATEFAEHEQSFTPESRATFQARLAEPESRLGTMSHDAFIAGVQWAIVAADNGHTEALTHEHHWLRIPIDVEWFADGLFERFSVAAGSLDPTVLIPLNFDDYAAGYDPSMAEVPSLLNTTAP